MHHVICLSSRTCTHNMYRKVYDKVVSPTGIYNWKSFYHRCIENSTKICIPKLIGILIITSLLHLSAWYNNLHKYPIQLKNLLIFPAPYNPKSQITYFISQHQPQNRHTTTHEPLATFRAREIIFQRYRGPSPAAPKNIPAGDLFFARPSSIVASQANRSALVARDFSRVRDTTRRYCARDDTRPLPRRGPRNFSVSPGWCTCAVACARPILNLAPARHNFALSLWRREREKCRDVAVAVASAARQNTRVADMRRWIFCHGDLWGEGIGRIQILFVSSGYFFIWNFGSRKMCI